MSVVIETTLGDFTVDLFVDERPQTCKNFLKLCKTKYYNFCLFHSVQHNFIAQTGDPMGTGKGGESVFKKIHGEERKYFAAEIMPKIKHSKPGLLSMVNCGNNMLGSQFFLTLSSELQSLDSEHCVFGELGEGHEILLKLNEVICDDDHRPYQDIRITHTIILEDPFEDPPGLEVPDQSPEPTKENLVNGRIGPDEELDESKGLSAQQLEEMVRAREAQAQATILEIVGDLPDADMAPPENVLFICKLNPVTSDDDLEIIFSRFGKVKSCEVIRDKVSGDSLQYAFVEFEEQKSCEDAFFKMDNVLIDDRRIHVDFSQSVSKLRWKGKGRGVEHIGESNFKKSSDHSVQPDSGSGRTGKQPSGNRRSTENERGNNRDQKHGDDRHRKTTSSDSRLVNRRDDHRNRPYEKLQPHNSARRERDSDRSRHTERYSEKEHSFHNRGNNMRSRDSVKEIDRKRTKQDEGDVKSKKMRTESNVARRSSRKDDNHRRPHDNSKTMYEKSEKSVKHHRSKVSSSDSDSSAKASRKKQLSKNTVKVKRDKKLKKSKKTKKKTQKSEVSSSSSSEERGRSKKSKRTVFA